MASKSAAGQTFTLVSRLSNEAMISPEQLASYRDKKRLLLVFAPSADDPRYLEQRGWLEARAAGLKERDLSVFYLTPSGAASLYGCFSVAESGFTVVLIGKDGTEKRRYSEPVQPDELFSTIDQMPMRRREMSQER